VLNFEVFWHTFAERYALFDLRGIDWAAAYAAHRPRIDADTSVRRLFEVFVDMLRPLGDGHVELRASCGHFSPTGVSQPQRRLARQLGRDPREEAALRSVFELRDRARAIIRQRYLVAQPRHAANGLLEWGRLDDATGYLAIEAMAGLSGANRARRDQRAAAAGMERALRELGHLPSLVVDVRCNGGGYDGVALRIAGYLIDRRRLAFAKMASKTVGYGARQTIFIEPRGKPRYKGRIFLLTSGLTASAAEIFVLALLQRPELTRIGEPTLGEQSDVMERHLPNGWELHLSNELYHASDDEIYEERGVPPHVAIPFLDLNDIEAGRDPMLDFVLAQR
jgi:C-terminal processing protease CtpA/Prc